MQANQLAPLENIVCGEERHSTSFDLIREDLTKYDPEIAKIEAAHGPTRVGDTTHTRASIEEVKKTDISRSIKVKQGLTQIID